MLRRHHVWVTKLKTSKRAAITFSRLDWRLQFASYSADLFKPFEGDYLIFVVGNVTMTLYKWLQR